MEQAKAGYESNLKFCDSRLDSHPYKTGRIGRSLPSLPLRKGKTSRRQRLPTTRIVLPSTKAITFIPHSFDPSFRDGMNKRMTRLGFDPRTLSVLRIRDIQLHHPAGVILLLHTYGLI